jgi:23S rRNA (uracil1939-C5)-methyltransferase
MHETGGSVLEKNDILTVTIEDLTAEGEGVGKADGFPLFIKDTVPGDVVRCSVMKLKKGYGYARLLEILTPSPDRTEPRCPIARSCGGCQLEHLSYEAQLRFKTKRVEDTLRRIGGFTVRTTQDEAGEEDSILLYPALGMKDPWHYRNKAQVPIGKDREGRIVTGFYARHSHEIIPMEFCAISFPESQLVLRTVKEWMLRFGISAYDEVSGTGVLRHVLARKGMRTGEILVCLVSRKRKVRHEIELAEMLRDAVPGFATLTVNINEARDNVILGREGYVAYGAGFIEDEIGGLRFRISPESFFQVNSEQMEVLYGKALEFAGLTGEETVWDLYSGIGTISLFLARKAKHVYGVEIVPQAVRDARENARLNGLANVTFYEGAAEEVLPRWREEHPGEHIDVIVVDPPRKGLDLTCLETICRIAPPKVVYVSCDPATLARDLALFRERGYHAELAQPVDQFCQTVHVETVCCLYHQKKDFISVPYEPKDAEYRKQDI